MSEAHATTRLVYQPDHKGEAERQLLWQFRDKPRILSVVRALVQQVQHLEDEWFNVLVSTILPTATGQALDQWGALVGELRGNLTLDAEYRRFIEARVMANYSGGTIEDLLAIWRKLTQSTDVRYAWLGEAAFTLYCLRSSPMRDDYRGRVARMIADAKPAGVTMELIEASYGYFGFEHDETAEPFDVGAWARLVR